MSDEDAFVRQICENPLDDTVRLVYADWLQENGHADRCELIRRQYGSAELDVLPLIHWNDWFQTDEFFGHGFNSSWNKGTRNILLNSYGDPGESILVISRGFVESVFLPYQSFKKKIVQSMFLRHPIVEVCCQVSPHNGFEWILFKSLIDHDVFDIAARSPKCSPVTRSVPHGTFDGIKFDSEEDIVTTLSQAVVSHCRTLANLPPLTV